MSRTHKILLCEDEVFVARSYVRKLELEGFVVSHAHNGQEALDKIESEKPDLVILDLMMPLKTGFDVLNELQKKGTLKDGKLPIIVASNLGQKSDIEEAMKLGAIDFLVKSNISLKELIEKVRAHLPA